MLIKLFCTMLGCYISPWTKNTRFSVITNWTHLGIHLLTPKRFISFTPACLFRYNVSRVCPIVSVKIQWNLQTKFQFCHFVRWRFYRLLIHLHWEKRDQLLFPTNETWANSRYTVIVKMTIKYIMNLVR